MAVIGQSHLLWRSRVPDHIYHSNTIVKIVPTEVVPGLLGVFSALIKFSRINTCISCLERRIFQ